MANKLLCVFIGLKANLWAHFKGLSPQIGFNLLKYYLNFHTVRNNKSTNSYKFAQNPVCLQLAVPDQWITIVK